MKSSFHTQFVREKRVKSRFKRISNECLVKLGHFKNLLGNFLLSKVGRKISGQSLFKDYFSPNLFSEDDNKNL
jgi:hypothetical protein